MPVINEWVIPQRVLETRLIGSVTADELAESSKQGTAMIESGEAPVFSLVDMTELERYPIRMTEIKVVYAQGTSSKLSWIIVFGIPNGVVNFLATLFTQLISRQYRVVKTRDEALALVDKLMMTSRHRPDH